MSLITKNQITIIQVSDGAQGDPGTPGESLYSWVAYAEDTIGTGLSKTPFSTCRYIGHAYNKADSDYNINEQEIWKQFTWTPYVLFLLAEKIQVTETGAIYANFSADGNTPPASGKGFYLGADGRFRAKDGELLGFFKSGESAPDGVRVGIKEEVGIESVDIAGVTGLNDLSVSADGTQPCTVRVKINSVTAVPSYAIGDVGPGGGTIFYDKGNWDDGWRYLEAAPETWNGGAADPTGQMLTVDIHPGFYTTAFWQISPQIGNGDAFTDELIDITGFWPIGNAASLARGCSYGGKSDWYLPVTPELELLYAQSLIDTGSSYWGADADLYKLQQREPFDGNEKFYILQSSGLRTYDVGRDSYHKIRPIRKVQFTPTPDTFVWNVDAGAWSNPIDITTGISHALTNGIAISFSNENGHTLGDTWVLEQAGLAGISVLDTNGNEFFAAKDGEVTAINVTSSGLIKGNVNTEATRTTYKVWGAVAN